MPYTEFQMRIRESLRALIAEQPDYHHLDNQSLNVLTELLLAALARAGFVVTERSDNA